MSLGNFIIKEMGEFERICHTGGILSEREGGRERKVVFFFSCLPISLFISWPVFSKLHICFINLFAFCLCPVPLSLLPSPPPATSASSPSTSHLRVCLVGFRCPSPLFRPNPLLPFLLSVSECFSTSSTIRPPVNFCLSLSFSLSHYFETRQCLTQRGQ